MKRTNFCTRRPALRGQSAVEFLIIFPILIFMIFGIIQWALIYQARSTLNHATFLAARAGALNNGKKTSMESGLAAGLTPLFASDASMTGYATARAKAQAEISAAKLATIEVLNPTAAAFQDFGQARLDGGTRRELPNDTLIYRNVSAGGASRVSIQDANILHVRVTYCYRLIVPVVGRMIHAVSNALTPFDASLQSIGMSKPFGVLDGPSIDSCTRPLVAGPRIRIRSEAIVRMQSPFYEVNL